MWVKVKPCFCGFCVVQESVLILAYANDIDITGRKQGTVKEAFISLEKADKESTRKNKIYANTCK
jgi:hypothetical protein